MDSMSVTLGWSQPPYIEIVEQPKKKGLRFRYPTEMRKAGSIYGEHQTETDTKYPSIRVCNLNGPFTLHVFCVTTKGELHPHKLVGDNCTEVGLYTKAFLFPPSNGIISIKNVGVQCCKKDDIRTFLEQKKKWLPNCRLPNINSIDLTTVCLMFMLQSPNYPGIPTISSKSIVDKKHCCDLTISRVSTLKCSANERSCEMFILCNKVKKEDVEVVFSLDSWEGYGSFVSTDVFKECAIVCKVPPFHNEHIKQPVTVHLFLREKSSQECGNSLLFTYTPANPDRYGISMKRKLIVPTMTIQPSVQHPSQLPQCLQGHNSINEVPNTYEPIINQQFVSSCTDGGLTDNHINKNINTNVDFDLLTNDYYNINPDFFLQPSVPSTLISPSMPQPAIFNNTATNSTNVLSQTLTTPEVHLPVEVAGLLSSCHHPLSLTHPSPPSLSPLSQPLSSSSQPLSSSSQPFPFPSPSLPFLPQPLSPLPQTFPSSSQPSSFSTSNEPGVQPIDIFSLLSDFPSLESIDPEQLTNDDFSFSENPDYSWD